MNNNNQEILEERFRQLRFFDKGLISLKEAAGALNLSYRQTQRLLKRLRDNNWVSASLAPQSRGGWNKRQVLREKVINLHQQRPERSNPGICDLLKEQGIKASVSTIRRIRIQNGFYKQAKIEKRFFKKFEAKAFGHLLQMDTMETYTCLTGALTKLILVIDDYSRAILAFKWVRHDTAWHNILVLRKVVEERGLPAVVYTDNDSKFRTIRHNKSFYQNHKQEGYETQIRRALKELEIALVCHPPYQAFCKGKIERLFGFIQSRFLPETRAQSLKQLNQEFKKWACWYNNNHINRMTGCKPKERFMPNGFKSLPGKEDLDLDYIFSLRITRKIDKYNSFSFKRKQCFLKTKEPLWPETVTLALNPNHCIRVYDSNKKFLAEFKIKPKN